MNRRTRFQYEHISQPLLPREQFRERLRGHIVFSVGLLVLALLAGVLGYRLLENMAWIDALLNASMILGGMGPVGELHTVAGKLFASFYALFSGVVFIATVGIVIAPLAHRLLHRLHVEDGTSRGDD